MAHKPPWKDIPDTNLVPEDAYAFTVKEMTEGTSKQSDTAKAKLMYTVVLKIDEPKAFKGIQLYDRFTVGTDDDVNAEDPETWKASFAARRLKQFLSALKIDFGDDMDDSMENAEGQKAIAMVTVQPKRTDPKTGMTYNESNQIAAYYAIGTPNIMVGGQKKPSSGGAPVPPKAKPKAPPVSDDGEAAQEAKPAQTAQLVKPKKVTKGDTTTCPICGKDDVLRTEFILHVNSHTGEEASEEAE